MGRRSMVQGRFDSTTDEWGTPLDLFQTLDREFNFTLDPCANPNRILKQGIKSYTKENTGLWKLWTDERVFVNPPYSSIDEWAKKCYMERNRAECIVFLIFSRTDTDYFHEYIYGKSELRFIRGRLRFVPIGQPLELANATFPSMLCIYRRNMDGILPTTLYSGYGKHE